MSLWQCCGRRWVLGINILIARDSPSNDGPILLFFYSLQEMRRRKGGGGYNHLVFCLSFPTFAPMTIPFRHTRDKEVFERTKKREQINTKKKDPKRDLGILPYPGSSIWWRGSAKNKKKREFSHFFAWRAWGFVILQIPLSCSLISAYLYIQLFLFYFFTTLHFFRFDFLFEQFFFFSPPSVSAQQINKYNKNGMAPISKYTRSVKPYLPI